MNDILDRKEAARVLRSAAYKVQHGGDDDLVSVGEVLDTVFSLMESPPEQNHRDKVRHEELAVRTDDSEWVDSDDDPTTPEPMEVEEPTPVVGEKPDCDGRCYICGKYTTCMVGQKQISPVPHEDETVLDRLFREGKITWVRKGKKIRTQKWIPSQEYMGLKEECRKLNLRLN